MNCPVCGADLKDKKVCECGWEEKEEKTAEEVVEETTEQVLPEDEDKVFNIEGVDDEALASTFGTPEELDEYLREYEIDFKKIQENEQKQKAKKKTPWGVAFVSLIAGVLATLIVIGSLNGTIVNLFDRVMYGSPQPTVENFVTAFFETYDAKGVVKQSSPCLLSNFNANIGDVEAAEQSVNGYFEYMLYNNALIKAKFKRVIEFEYIKNGTDEFEDYLDEYKALGDEKLSKVKDITAFYSALIELETEQYGETYPSYTEVICVKINGDWLVHSF